MTTQMFVNLPVKDLNRSIEFFTKLDFEFDPQLSDEKGTCMIVNKESFVMLLTESFFKMFTTKQICDAKKSTEMAVSLSIENRERVDELVNKAKEAGGLEEGEPQDNGGCTDAALKILMDIFGQYFTWMKALLAKIDRNSDRVHLIFHLFTEISSFQLSKLSIT